MRHFLFLLWFFVFPLLLRAQQGTTHWYQRLPACPCKNPDLNAVKLGDGWARDRGDVNKYHKGAAASYRSYPAVKTQAGHSGQQCCYDGAGNLITKGRAAGTPDKVSTCSGENSKGEMKVRFFALWEHYCKDVLPWIRYMKSDSAGWRTYNLSWVPNNGDCPENLR